MGNEIVSEKVFYLNRIDARQLTIRKKYERRSKKFVGNSYQAHGRVEGKKASISIFLPDQDDLKNHIFIIWKNREKWFIPGEAMYNFCEGDLKVEEFKKLCLVRNYSEKSLFVPYIVNSKNKNMDRCMLSVFHIKGTQFKVTKDLGYDEFEAQVTLNKEVQTTSIVLSKKKDVLKKSQFCFHAYEKKWILNGVDFLNYCKGDILPKHLGDYCQTNKIKGFLTSK